MAVCNNEQRPRRMIYNDRAGIRVPANRSLSRVTSRRVEYLLPCVALAQVWNSSAIETRGVEKTHIDQKVTHPSDFKRSAAPCRVVISSWRSSLQNSPYPWYLLRHRALLGIHPWRLEAARVSLMTDRRENSAKCPAKSLRDIFRAVTAR